MEVKPGYKQTEVGIIPEDWNEFTVGELIIFEGGSQPNKSHFRLTQKPGYCRLIQIRDYKTDNFEVFVPKILARRFCDENDIMIGRYGPPVFQILRGLAGAYNVALIKAVPSEGLNREFAYYFLTQDTLFQFIDKLSRRTSGQTGVDLKELRSYPFPLPPTIFEQHAIATALSDVDALLDGLDRLIAKKRNLKQAAMQQLLTGQTRLPGFSGEWEVKRLVECLLSRPEYGINAPAVSYSDRLPTYIRITDITENGRFRPAPRVSVQSTFADRYLLNDGDVVFARTGASVGKSYQYCPEDGPLVFAGFLIRVRPDRNTLLSAYLSAYVLTNSYWSWVRLMSMRSGQPGINGNEYAQLLIRLPPIEEQTAIAAILSDMDAELAALEARRDKTRALKQGMMQELLTGRIRLVDPSIPKLSEGETDASTATGH